MAWVGTFFNSSDELFAGGLEGYFTLSVNTGGGVPSTLDTTTNAAVSIGMDNFLGRINFFGNNLTTGSVQLPIGTPLPVLTGGTITRITFEYNYSLSRVIEFGGDPTPFFDPQFLEPSADIRLPNVNAAALTAAIVESYETGSVQPFVDFVSQETVRFTGTNGANSLSGADGNDVLLGLGGNDLLFGSGGDDILNGGAGTDGMNGGEGSDLYLPGPPELNGLVGDSVSDSGLTPGDIDTISYANATSGVTVDLNGLDGDQSAGWAKGLIASGIEAVIGSNFDDTLIGTDFPESVQDTAADILMGGRGDDRLFGLSGSDVLQGGSGFDTLVGGANGDIANPGPGDTARFNAAVKDLEVFFQNDGSVLVAAPGGGVDTLFGMEFVQATDGTFAISSFTGSSSNLLVGTAGDSPLTGTNGKDLIFGRDGNDTLSGLAGNDVLEGENGNDTINGGKGNDFATGGAGNDVLKGLAGNDVLGGDTGRDTLLGGGGGDTLFGGDDADKLNGGDGNDDLQGGTGRDVIRGAKGGDTLNGGVGNDLLIGGNGNDSLVGGAGKDKLTGGLGRDLQTGGAGADRFIFDSKAETGKTTAKRDVIKDFSHAQGDRIDLSGIDAKSASGDQAFTFIGKSVFSSDQGELRYTKSGGKTFIKGDIDGDGVKDFEIALDGLHTLIASDFIL